MKKFFLFLISFIGVIVIGFGISYAYFDNVITSKIFDGGKKTELDIEQDKLNKILEEQNGYGSDRPLVYLVTGIDTADVSSGRTDALMLAMINADKKKLTLLSIPRDLYVNIDGHGMDKINAAYAYGGIGLTKNTVSNLFSVPIDQYVSIDFNGFQELVDALGGIQVYVEKDLRFHDRISNQYFELSEGLQTLDGFHALNYARFRKDAEGDFGRMRRQQDVINQIISETASLKNLTKLDDVFDALGNNVSTDVPFKNMSSLAVSYIGFSSSKDTSSIVLEAEPQMIGGVSYVVASQSSIDEVKRQINAVLLGEDPTAPASSN